MIAVIFEVVIDDARREAYLGIAAALHAQLARVEGFVSVERFQSLGEPNKLLSLSFWRDEDAVRRWRNLEAHRAAQHAGRGGIFSDYRLRVAAVLRDYGMDARDEAPADAPHAPRRPPSPP